MFDSIEKSIEDFLNSNNNLKLVVLILVAVLMFMGFDDKKLNEKIKNIKG